VWRRSACDGESSVTTVEGSWTSAEGELIVYRKRLLRFGEVWLQAPIPTRGVDVIRCIQRPRPLANVGCDRFDTRVLDLALPAETLLAQMDSSTRYEIRRAENKDGITGRIWRKPDAGVLEEFHHSYSEFARVKGIANVDLRRLVEYGRVDRLVLTQASSAEVGSVAWHVYLILGARARLLSSVSGFRGSQDVAERALSGRANRFLHWFDILRFKERELRVYDLGGWYGELEDDARRKIDDFKRGFGGEVVPGWSCEIAGSPAGRAYLTLKRLAGRSSP